MHALSWPTAATTSRRTGASTLPDPGGLLHAAAESALRTAAGDAADVLGPDRVCWSVVPGDPADALAASASAAELLVLGSRGVGGVAGPVLGSTATAGRTTPPCPALVLLDTTTAVIRTRVTVVAAVEGRPGDDAVLASAFAEAAARGTDLLAVHAWQDVSLESALLSAGPLVDWAGVLADEQRVLAEALAGWREKEPDVTVREAVVLGAGAVGLPAGGRPRDAVAGRRPGAGAAPVVARSVAVRTSAAGAARARRAGQGTAPGQPTGQHDAGSGPAVAVRAPAVAGRGAAARAPPVRGAGPPRGSRAAGRRGRRGRGRRPGGGAAPRRRRPQPGDPPRTLDAGHPPARGWHPGTGGDVRPGRGPPRPPGPRRRRLGSRDRGARP